MDKRENDILIMIVNKQDRISDKLIEISYKIDKIISLATEEEQAQTNNNMQGIEKLLQNETMQKKILEMFMTTKE